MTRDFIVHPVGHPAREPVITALHRYIDRELAPNTITQVSFGEPAFSRSAQGYWHGTVVDAIRRGLFPGETPALVHEWLCGEYFGWRPSRIDGRSVPVRTTTTNEAGDRAPLRKSEFGALIEWATAWAAERGVIVPEPTKTFRGPP